MKTIIKIYLAVVAVSLVCFASLPAVQAVVPPPNGGYPGFNTAEGTNALQNLTTGVGNAAVGWHSLLATPTAASIPPWARGRCFSMSETKAQVRESKTRPLVRQRF